MTAVVITALILSLIVLAANLTLVAINWNVIQSGLVTLTFRWPFWVALLVFIFSGVWLLFG